MAESMSSGGSVLPGNGGQNGYFWGWMTFSQREVICNDQFGFWQKRNSLDQVGSFDYIPVPALHM